MHDQVPVEVLLAFIAAINAAVHGMSRALSWAISRKKEPTTDVELGKKVCTLTNAVDKLLDSDARRQKMIDEMVKVHADQDRKIDEMYEMHKAKDSDGRPVWWFPPRMLDLSQQQLDELRDISAMQKEAAMIMQSIVRDLAAIKGDKSDAR